LSFSHFSDVSSQDLTTTNAHTIDVLIRDLKVEGRLWAIFLKKFMGVAHSIAAEPPSDCCQCFPPNSESQLTGQLEHLLAMAKMLWMAS
jgi:hypothetical protein